jgi:hypothetical protein
MEAGCGKDPEQSCLEHALTQAGSAPEHSEFVEACEDRQGSCPGLPCDRFATPRMAAFAPSIWSESKECLAKPECDAAKLCVAATVVAKLLQTRACLGEKLVAAPAAPEQHKQPEQIESGTIAGVRLGAPRSNFSGLVALESQSNRFRSAQPLRYGGTDVTGTYEFERRGLSRFHFRASSGCAGVASALKRDFGQPSQVGPTVSGGREWEWRRKQFVLTLTEDAESCEGVLEAL